jgi:hypothetical protein
MGWNPVDAFVECEVRGFEKRESIMRKLTIEGQGAFVRWTLSVVCFAMVHVLSGGATRQAVAFQFIPVQGKQTVTQYPLVTPVQAGGCSTPIHGEIVLRYSGGAIVHEGVLSMRGCVGVLLTRFSAIPGGR